jgi:hypothetical protein
MSEETNTPNSEYVKPCVKCGAQERNSRGNCRPCKRKAERSWRNANLEKERERKRLQLRRMREADPEKFLEYNRKWVGSNRDKRREANRRWEDANPERRKESNRRWEKANKEKRRDYQRQYREANPEKRRAYSQNRKAKIKGSDGKLSRDIVGRLMALQKGKCACCGKSLKQGYHLDHIMPLALGGKNIDSNIQLLTPFCNMSKSAKHPDDWARENGRLL